MWTPARCALYRQWRHLSHVSVHLDELLWNVVRLCFRHRLLPLLVGRYPPLESRVPLLCPHYQASSLVRTRPSLGLASVLGSSWVHHLEVSLNIKAQVPTFHTRASRWSHAVLATSQRGVYFATWRNYLSCGRTQVA